MIDEMEGEMSKIELLHEKIIVTGNGRVGNGCYGDYEKV